MKFNSIPYERPDIISFKQKFNTLLSNFENAKTENEQADFLNELYKMRSHFETMMNVASTKNSIDTTDPFYEAEQYFFDLHEPDYRGLVHQFYEALIKARFRNFLEQKYGKQLFTIAELTIKTFHPDIIEDLQKENQLGTEYTKLVASAKLNYHGKELNLSELIPYKLDTNRTIRKEASNLADSFFENNKNEFERIFAELVSVRNKIAVTLGFKNFVELGYVRMLRSDYDSNMVAAYRKKILDHVVPLVTKLKKAQQQRLQLDSFFIYDDGLDYPKGNAQPKGSSAWILENARTMYSELSLATKEFFDFMIENNMMDLETKPNKAGGGYCTFFSEIKSPFIFSNFNGTSNDIDVLTHEAGHAFQGYSSRHWDIEEYFFPTYEACEIHSMSMEFLTWPWMPLFFKEDANRYYFSHLSHSLSFLPYGVAVDEFQHWVYENSDCTPSMRNQQWRAIEKKYMPWRKYDNNAFMESGGFWQRQSHIYRSPFYYIDYTLAQICAFQFWKKSMEQPSVAINDYIRLCKEGGSKSFLELVKVANLKSPFDEGTLEEVVAYASDWLEHSAIAKTTLMAAVVK